MGIRVRLSLCLLLAVTWLFSEPQLISWALSFDSARSPEFLFQDLGKGKVVGGEAFVPAEIELIEHIDVEQI